MAKASTRKRKIILAIVLITTIITASISYILLFSPFPILAHYGDRVGQSGSNLVGFDITIYSPLNNRVYSNSMPLHFKIDWIYGLMFYDNAKQYALYAYKIDNNPSDSLPSNQKSNSSKDFIAHPSFSSNIDISNLTNGQHQLVIIADMEWNPFGGGTASVCNQSSSPILFSVQNSKPSPMSTATVSVKADSNEPITFSSGLALYSPLNTIYSSNVVEM